MKSQVFLPVEPAEPATDLKNRLIDKFGGFTIFNAHGAWKMPDGTTCLEPVEIVEVFSPNQDSRSNEEWFFRECEQYVINAKQDAVLIVHGDEPTFIHTNAALQE